MDFASLFWSLVLFGCSFRPFARASDDDTVEYMTREEREALKEEARDMFYHAYNAYMDNAYPADELMPLSCKGRYRGSEANRGDIDATLGNFSLTLVDTLDTLVLLGDLEEFENAVKLVARDVTFDTDVIVSLFETNIRMLGGLLSAHILAEYLQQRADIMPWYRGELLDLAKDLGYRFLPAFNTTTGIPYGRINLKHGMKGVPIEVSRETCTACAGSMILEMAALSRLTGEPLFEEKAQKAMDVLWKMRHRGTDLMGSVLNVNSGDWVRRDSGVGAGIDSYYEYCLKAYILLGDEKYLGRFNRHYQAVMKYVSQGPMLLDVHMHRPNTNSKNFMDALLAFWPGLQVLKGDIKPAVETHEMLYQVMQRHNFIPEAFTTDFQVHWGHHPLRPEFLESTYFLYRATGDHYYLGVGRKVLKSLQTYARVPCGYAAVSDVRTNKHDDTMDSFVLSETLKYLFLLFAEPSELVLDLDEFVFTTEGHLLPLTLASIGTNSSSGFEKDMIDVDEFDRACPNSLHLFPASVRQPLRNMVEDVCPRRTPKRKLNASQFQASNLEHLTLLSDMGITILTLADGRVQLLHTYSNAKTAQDAEEGLLFMQEMVELSKMQTQQADTRPQAVTFSMPNIYPTQEATLLAGPAHFGPELRGTANRVTGKIVYTDPLTACSDLVNADKLAGKIVIMERGDCMFVEKARRIQKVGALAGIVLDNVVGSSAATSPMFAMSGDGKGVDDITIPVVFLFSAEASRLVEAVLAGHGHLTVTIEEYSSKDEAQLKAPNDLSIFERLKGTLKEFLARQMSPQSSDNAGPAVTLPDIQGEEEQKVLVEYAHLMAEISQRPNEEETSVRVSVNLDGSINVPKETEDRTDFERRWRFLRKMFVNQIFTNTMKGSSLYMKGSVIKGYYKWVQTERGLSDDVINNINLSRKVFWFLKELSDVGSVTSYSKADEASNRNRQKLELLRQHLLSKMDDMAFPKNVALKLKSLKSAHPDMEQLIRQLEAGKVKVENYGLFGKLLREIFEGEDESVSQHIALLENLQRAVRTENPSEVLINQLRRELGNTLEMKNFPRPKEDDIVSQHSESDDPGDKKYKSFEKPEESLKSTRGVSTNLDDFEDFILTEIERVGKQRSEFRMKDSKKSATKLESGKTEEPNEPGVDAKTRNGSKDANRQNKIEIPLESKEGFLKQLEDTDVQETNTADNNEIPVNEQIESDYAKTSEINSNSMNLEKVSIDERQKLLQEIQKELGDSQKNTKSSEAKEVLRSDDPLEEYKKPVWASDEGKITKEFSEFQQKPEISSGEYGTTGESDFEYQEYVVKGEIDSKDKGRRIEDEL